MSIEHRMAQLFGMDDATWKRHANPWSLWTRVAGAPFILLAIWSFGWIGIWAIIPLAAMFIWLWINPRLFAPPHTTQHWESKATFGERVWLNRHQLDIPAHHEKSARVLGVIGSLGFLLAIVSAGAHWFWPCVAGYAVHILGKLWFCDRMVWLYGDMKDKDPEYGRWLY